MALYSTRTNLIGTENAFKIGPHIVNVESGGQAVVRLNLGEPDFNAPQWVMDEIIRQIKRDNTHYCDPKGIVSFRKAIANQLNETRKLNVTAEHVCVFPGGKPSIAFTQQIYCNPGDEIIYPSPGFPIYESFVEYFGAVPVPLQLEEDQNFTFTPQQLESLITPKTKLIILNFPSNPTGGVATRDQLYAIADVIMATCSDDVRVYSDEIYENIIFDGQEHFSIASVPGMEKRTIISSGLSKSFAWTGGRIGYVATPTIKEADIFKNMNINYFSCIPPYNQEAGREALENPKSKPWMAEMTQTFQDRRDAIQTEINAIDGIHCQKPGGAFYLFPNIFGMLEHLDAFGAFNSLSHEHKVFTSPATLFQMFALYEHKVAVMDRQSFGKIGAEDKHFLRISIASDLASLREGLRRIEAAGKDINGFQRFIDQGKNLY